jgi:hypothetical protein
MIIQIIITSHGGSWFWYLHVNGKEIRNGGPYDTAGAATAAGFVLCGSTCLSLLPGSDKKYKAD